MEPPTPTQNSLSTQTIPLLIWTTPSPNILLRLKVCIPSVVPKTGNLSTGVKILSVFKKADRWIAKIFVAKLLPYVQHSHVTQPQNNKTNSDSVKNLCSAQLLFLLNFISVKGYFLKCCEVWPELSMKDLFFVFLLLFPGMKYKTKGGLLSALKPGLPHTITEKSNKAQGIYETLVTRWLYER